jgi:hypothetical protein
MIHDGIKGSILDLKAAYEKEIGQHDSIKRLRPYERTAGAKACWIEGRI